MFQDWTFGRKLAAGFALVVGFSLAIGAVAVHSLRSVVVAKDRVIAVHAQNLIDAEALDGATHARVSAVRAFLLTGEDRFLTQQNQERAQFLQVLSTLRRRVRTDEGRRLLDAISTAELVHHKAAEKVLQMRKDHEPATGIIRYFDQTVVPAHQRLLPTLDAFQQHERRLLGEKRARATAIAGSAVRLVILFVAAALALAAGLALFLTRTLARQIGSAVQYVQSSSTELQVAANQQAAGAKEQASSMNEITTTIRELLVTSRQIAESAQRVTRIADEAVSAATTGATTVSEADQSLAGIKHHVDLIVSHMLELGKKSQRIGGILEVINELAEQTNILAINATIEAVGAGEAGRRFAVVGEEIRKLADRVGGSTKEIRALIEEVRAAVNTTVMATEGGSKAVDAGTHQFEEVAGAFRRIADLVGTTTEAAREIELSTQQQATAVEQVTLSVATVSQASKENEASTGQTLQTASQLADLSRDLGRLVQRQKVV